MNYLEQLTSRALDVAPVVQPRVPTVFEPVNASTAALQEVLIEQETRAREVSLKPVEVPVAPISHPTSAAQAQPTAASQPVSNMSMASQAPPPMAAQVRIERETHELREVQVERHIESRSVLSPPVRPLPASPIGKPALQPALRLETRSAPTLAPVTATAAVTRDTHTSPQSETRIIEVPVARAQRAPSPVPRAPITPPAIGTLLPKVAPPAIQAPPATTPVVTPPSRAAAPPIAKPAMAQAQHSLRAAAAPRIAPATPPRSEPPVIEISIGRVDVRAVTQPAPSASPRSRVAAPMVSLDDYLKHKDGGSP